MQLNIAVVVAAAAVARDVGTRTHKTRLCPGVRRTSFVKKIRRP